MERSKPEYIAHVITGNLIIAGNLNGSVGLTLKRLNLTFTIRILLEFLSSKVILNLPIIAVRVADPDRTLALAQISAANDGSVLEVVVDHAAA